MVTERMKTDKDSKGGEPPSPPLPSQLLSPPTLWMCNTESWIQGLSSQGTQERTSHRTGGLEIAGWRRIHKPRELRDPQAPETKIQVSGPLLHVDEREEWR